MIDRRSFYNKRAVSRLRETNRYYQHFLRRSFSFLVPYDMRVLELGCGLGDLLASVRPARGVGIDFSPEMISLARTRHPELSFHIADAQNFSCNEDFDYFLLADLVHDLIDVQAVLENLQKMARPSSR